MRGGCRSEDSGGETARRGAGGKVRDPRGAPGIRRVYASRANFVLVRFDDAQSAFERLLAAGVVVRDMRAAPGLDDALRISLGTPQQNASVLSILEARA